MNEEMKSLTDLQKLRDELAQQHYDDRAKIFNIHEFDRETIAVESYKLGWDACHAEMQKENQLLREVIDGLTKKCMAMDRELISCGRCMVVHDTAKQAREKMENGNG